jgi:hypothetical protein
MRCCPIGRFARVRHRRDPPACFTLNINNKGKEMQKRPVSITIIAWILIVLGGISVISTTMMSNNSSVLEAMHSSPLPIPLQWTMFYAGMLVMVVSGIGFLKGRNWSRYLYLIWSIVGFAIGFATSPMKTAMIPGFVFFLIVAAILFLPKSSAYFLQPTSSGDAQAV